MFCPTDGSGSRKFGSAQSVNQADSDLRGRHARARADCRHAGDACADRNVELRRNRQLCTISAINWYFGNVNLRRVRDVSTQNREKLYTSVVRNYKVFYKKKQEI